MGRGDRLPASDQTGTLVTLHITFILLYSLKQFTTSAR